MKMVILHDAIKTIQNRFFPFFFLKALLANHNWRPYIMPATCQGRWMGMVMSALALGDWNATHKWQSCLKQMIGKLLINVRYFGLL